MVAGPKVGSVRRIVKASTTSRLRFPSPTGTSVKLPITGSKCSQGGRLHDRRARPLRASSKSKIAFHPRGSDCNERIPRTTARRIASSWASAAAHVSASRCTSSERPATTGGAPRVVAFAWSRLPPSVALPAVARTTKLPRPSSRVTWWFSMAAAGTVTYTVSGASMRYAGNGGMDSVRWEAFSRVARSRPRAASCQPLEPASRPADTREVPEIWPRSSGPTSARESASYAAWPGRPASSAHSPPLSTSCSECERARSSLTATKLPTRLLSTLTRGTLASSVRFAYGGLAVRLFAVAQNGAPMETASVKRTSKAGYHPVPSMPTRCSLSIELLTRSTCSGDRYGATVASQLCGCSALPTTSRASHSAVAPRSMPRRGAQARVSRKR